LVPQSVFDVHVAVHQPPNAPVLHEPDAQSESAVQESPSCVVPVPPPSPPPLDPLLLPDPPLLDPLLPLPPPKCPRPPSLQTVRTPTVTHCSPLLLPVPASSSAVSTVE
jgi:hypothetical protein